MADGRVTVAGEVVTDPARDVDDASGVEVDGRPRRGRAARGPRRSTSRRAWSRPPATRTAARRSSTSWSRTPRLYPVGRLDADTTGLMLLTNDGELAERLTHPRYEVEKVYRARVEPPRVPERASGPAEGIELEEADGAGPGAGRSAAAELEIGCARAASARSAACARRWATGWSSSSGSPSARYAWAISSPPSRGGSRPPRWSACAISGEEARSARR